MLEHNFDPYDALEQLRINQVNLNDNQQQMARAIQNLINRVNHQQQVIDSLVRGLEQSNQANEILIKSLVNDIQQSLKEKVNG